METIKYPYDYYKIINAALSRDTPNDAYTEKHHIIPSCVGGPDTQDNLVELYADEHYLAHMYLAKANPNHYGLNFAWLNMSSTSNSKQRSYFVDAENYKLAKESFSKLQSINKILFFSKNENRAAHSKALIKYFEKEGSKERLKEILNSPKVKAKMSEKRVKYFENPENRQKFKAIQNSKETIERKKASLRKAPIWCEPMYSQLYKLWVDNNKPKCGRFSKIAIKNGFPNVDYRGLIDYDFSKKT